MGELSLDGSLQKLKGFLPIAIEAKKLGPKENHSRQKEWPLRMVIKLTLFKC